MIDHSYSRAYLEIDNMSALYHKDNNPLGTQKTVSLDFHEEQAREDSQGNFKISKQITFN